MDSLWQARFLNSQVRQAAESTQSFELMKNPLTLSRLRWLAAPLLPCLVLASAAKASLLKLDFDHTSQITQDGWQSLSANNADLGFAWSRENVPLQGGGSVTVSVMPVGSPTLDSRDRRNTPLFGGAVEAMWMDFLFANNGFTPDDGLDLEISGLQPNRYYPVRLWSFDKQSTGQRFSTWNGVEYVFNGSDAGPQNDQTNTFIVQVRANSAGTLRLEARANRPEGNTGTHHVFLNGLELGDPPAGLVDVVPSHTTIDRSAPAGATAATLSILHQQQPAPAVTYTLAAGEGSADNARFQIAGSELKLAAPASSWPTGTVFRARIRATETGGAFLEKPLTFTLTGEGPPPFAASLLKLDFDHTSQLTQAEWQSLSSLNTDLGFPWSRENVPLQGGGSVTVNVTPVGARPLDSRDRRGTANQPLFGGPVEDMWMDFLFLNGGYSADDGFDIEIAGLQPNRYYPVRLWSFDSQSNNPRLSTWNGVEYVFNGVDAEPQDDLTRTFLINVQTDGSGRLVIQARGNRPLTGNPETHHVFLNGLEIGEASSGPTGIVASKTTIHKDEPAGVTAATLSVLHESPAPVITYTLAAGEGDTDNARFQIDGNALKLIAAASASPVGTAFRVRVRATETASQFVEKAFTFTIVNDSDYDGLDDDWERRYFPNLLAASGEGHNDTDGLTNLQEQARGSDPTKNDTDGDGLSDFAETNTGFFINATSTGTDPAKADTDGDGLSDGVETNTRLFVDASDTGTHPLRKDTDRDGYTDGEEAARPGGYAIDPNQIDTDGDGFNDKEEITNAANPLSAASMPGFMAWLAAYWPLDELTGGSSALVTPDAANGLSLSATNLSQSSLIEGKFGKAVAFTAGQNTLLSRVWQPDEPLPISKFPNWTVSLWVRGVGTGQNDLRFFSEGSTSNQTPLLNLGAHNGGSSGVIAVYLRNVGTATHQYSGSEPLIGDGWHHIALVNDSFSTQQYLYIDGTLDNVFAYVNLATADPASTFMDTTSIGGILRAVASHWFTGDVDEVSLWRGALSEDQIAGLAAASTPLLGPPSGGDGFAITVATRDPGSGAVSLTWQSQTGVNYSIQYSTTMAEGSWTTLPGVIAGQAGSTSHEISSGLPAGGTLFLRVVR